MKEANRWCELKMLEKAGLIQDLQRQVKFELIPKQDGERAVHYVADFVYVEDGKKIVEDVKSAATKKNKEYVIKRKLLLWRHGIRIKEI
jgi:ABC-type dipeptide/oligopeptide/nickel transport system ATPase subunit